MNRDVVEMPSGSLALLRRGRFPGVTHDRRGSRAVTRASVIRLESGRVGRRVGPCVVEQVIFRDF